MKRRGLAMLLATLAILELAVACGGGDVLVLGQPPGDMSFALDTAVGESFTAVGVIQGLFPPGTNAPIELTRHSDGTGTVDFDFSDTGLPNVEFTFPDETFEFTILPDDQFSLTVDLENGHINRDLTDPPLMLLVERFVGGSGNPSSSNILELSLTTGTAILENCQGNQARDGEPIDPLTGAVKLRGLACLEELSEPITIQLEGLIPIEIPAPAPSALARAALLSLAALSYRRNGPT